MANAENSTTLLTAGIVQAGTHMHKKYQEAKLRVYFLL